MRSFLIRRFLRDGYYWLRGLFRWEEREYLSGVWTPSPRTCFYLYCRFGYHRWVVLRGGVRGRISGFMPYTTCGDGKKEYVTEGCVVDHGSVRGGAPLRLNCLEGTISHPPYRILHEAGHFIHKENV